MPLRKTVLLAPLDWGLGHTTRCLPLLRYLEDAGVTTVFAGSATQQAFIRTSFPDLECLPLPGYGVTYARTRQGFFPKLLAQLPKIRRAIRSEHRWLRALTAERHFDGIVSDNRYGLWHPSIPAVVLTHQLRVQTGLSRWPDTLFQRLHYRMLERFDQCWTVDAAMPPGLSGQLAHPRRLPSNVRYLGLLPQFESAGEPAEKRHLLILLSGPEPQRTLLSDRLWPQALALDRPVVFVEGKETAPPRTGNAQVTWKALATGDVLRTLLLQASYTVCRSGYSTLMDAAALGARLITIPTPGQPEQEYLGALLQAGGQAPCFAQETFSLQQALHTAASFPYHPLPAAESAPVLKTVLQPWLDSL